MKNKIGLLVPFVFIYYASFSQKINPENPDLSAGKFRFDSLPSSEINIPIQVNLKPLYVLAEKSVDTLFTSPGYPDEWLQEGCATRFKYSFRRSKLRMQASGTSLNLGFTGYYKIVGSTRLCINGTILSPWTPPCRCGFGEEGERRVQVSFTNSVSIQPDYKIRIAFRRNEPQPLDKCEVCFWGQDITKQVMKGLTTELDYSKNDLEKKYGTVDLKSRFQLVWNQLLKPYSLFGLGWLSINPQRFRLNGLFARNDSLNIHLGLSAKPVISFEQPREQPSSMPPIGTFSRNPGFSIFLDAVLGYDSLSTILNAQLKGKEFDFKKGFVKKKFILDSCSVYGGGFEKFIIRIQFSGTNKGVFYLVGKPVYDPVKKVIEVKEIDFDIKSKNVLLGSADWLFDKKITKEISQYARFELGAYIDSAKHSMEKELNREISKGIRSSGLMNEITLLAVYPMQQHLVIRTKFSGAMSIQVDSIPFSL